MQNEIEMLSILVFFATVLIIISWLDEAVELNLYSDASEASEYRVQPFGFWACLASEELLQVEALALERDRSSMMRFSGSWYRSIANLSKDNV